MRKQVGGWTLFMCINFQITSTLLRSVSQNPLAGHLIKGAP